MSAADAANRVHHPDTAPVPGGADVIHLSTRTPAARGRFSVTGHGHDDPPEGGMTAALADHIETTFNQHGLTLTDETVAGAFTVTLGVVNGLLEGARVQGLISDGAKAEVRALIDGLVTVPESV